MREIKAQRWRDTTRKVQRSTTEVNNFSTSGEQGEFSSLGGQTHLVLGHKIICRFGGGFSGFGRFGHLRERGSGLGGGEMIVVGGF